MRLQKTILCTAIALTAFGASLGLLEIGAYIRAAFQPMKVEFKAIEPISPPVYAPQRIPDFPMPAFSPTEEPAPVEEEEPEEWGKTGNYYILEEKGKGFEDFQWLIVNDHEYNEKLGKVMPIKPEGSIEIWLDGQDKGREFKYSRIEIKGSRLSLATKAKRGVSFQFEGKFVEEEITLEYENGEEYTETVYLKGRLSKWRDGKKIAEAKVKLGIYHGC